MWPTEGWFSRFWSRLYQLPEKFSKKFSEFLTGALGNADRKRKYNNWSRRLIFFPHTLPGALIQRSLIRYYLQLTETGYEDEHRKNSWLLAFPPSSTLEHKHRMKRGFAKWLFFFLPLRSRTEDTPTIFWMKLLRLSERILAILPSVYPFAILLCTHVFSGRAVVYVCALVAGGACARVTACTTYLPTPRAHNVPPPRCVYAYTCILAGTALRNIVISLDLIWKCTHIVSAFQKYFIHTRAMSSVLAS